MTFLSPRVFMAQVEDDLIILDVDADDYACLFGRASDIALADTGAIAAPADLEAALLSAGLVRQTPPENPRRSPTPARRAAEGAAPGPVAFLIAIVEAWCDAMVFRKRALSDLIVAPKRHPRPTVDPADVAAALAAALPWAPANGACLQRAFQLRRRLARRGVATDWLFGVRTWPFSAHCWLQIGDCVIGDRLERVRAYTPIAVF